MGRPAQEPRALGAPVDRLIAAYALLSGAALAFPHRPEGWFGLALVHGLAATIGFGPRVLQAAWRKAGHIGPRSAAWFHDWYPLLLIPLLYSELPLLNRSVYDGYFFDTIVQGWEQAIFGLQPSRALAQALPWPPLSELLHLGYLSYYLLVFGPPLLLYWSGRLDEYRNAVFALMLVFVTHYLFFVWFPVQGPRYLFPAPGGALADGPIYRFTHLVLEAGSSQGAAFPSSHVGGAVAQTLVCRRYLNRLWPAAALATLALAVGTVYGGFHYATDALAGAALGLGCAILALRAGPAARPGAGSGAVPPAGGS
jgi:membrane-associated phospholipid phosphatase